ncbi:hypothetical protein CHUAL_008343 [Chamberlinius hualienensis]
MISNFTLWISVTVVVLSLLWRYVEWQRNWAALIDKIPGPNTFQLLKMWVKILLAKREDDYSLITNLSRPYVHKYPIVKLRLGPAAAIFSGRYESAKIILGSHKNIRRANWYKPFTRFADGLLTNYGEEWHKHRKLINPSFNIRMLNEYVTVMNKHANIFVEIIEKRSQQANQPFDVYPYVSNCTLDIVCETTMGEAVNTQGNDDTEFIDAIRVALQIIHTRIRKPFIPDWLFAQTKLGKMEKKARTTIHDFVKKVIIKTNE